MGGRFNIPPPPQEPGSSEWWPALAALATALALALLFILLTRPGCAATAGVPGVAGEPAASASSTLREAGYTPIQEAAPSDVVPKGHVIDTVVSDDGSGSDVVVIVSSGPGQTARAPKPRRPSGGTSSTTASAASKAPALAAPVPERPAASTTVVSVTPGPPQRETAAGDAAVASGIRDQRTQVAAIEGTLVAPGAASDSAVVADARAALEDIAGQTPVSSASSCATAAQERWLASLNRALSGVLTPEAARALTAAADKAAAEVTSCSSASSGGTDTMAPSPNAIPAKANPPGSGPRVAFAYNTMSDLRAHLADVHGKLVGVGRTRAGDLLYDKSGTLWLSSGGWNNSGEATPGCNVRRFGDAAPAYAWAAVLARLIESGEVPASTWGNNLLCGPLDPAPEGGVVDVWEELSVRMPRRVGAAVVTSAAEPSISDGQAIWNGDVVTYSLDVDSTVTSSAVPGVGTVPGEVTFVSPGGEMLVADRGMENDPDEISLRRPNGSSQVVWPRSLRKKIAIHRQQGQTTAISRDGNWIFVQAVPSGTYSCMACSADLYRVDTAGTGRPVKVASGVVTLAVPPLPAQRTDG